MVKLSASMFSFDPTAPMASMSFEETQKMVEVGIALVTMAQLHLGLSMKHWRKRRQKCHGCPMPLLINRVAVIDRSRISHIRSRCSRRIEAKTAMLTGLRKPFLIRACQDAGSPSTAFGTRWLMRVPPFFVVGYRDQAPRTTPSTGDGDVSTVMRQSLIASFRATATMAFCPIPRFAKW